MKKGYFLVMLVILVTFPLHAKKIYITTGIPGYWGNSLFDRDAHKDGHLEPTCQLGQTLKNLGYEVIEPLSINQIKYDADIVVLFDLPNVNFISKNVSRLTEIKKMKFILFLWEPPSVLPYEYCAHRHEMFDKVYTWNDALVDNKKYFKFYYPRLYPMIDGVVSFEDKKLCTMVATNRLSVHENELYSARKEIIRFFQQKAPEDFDLYGIGWDAMQYACYRGRIGKKNDYLIFYRFCICYENIKNIPGYVTEKIFDCFRAGCVPVYWGASNIADTIPSNCFIDRNSFSDNQELYNFMKNMSETTYNNYIKNIAAYLNSEQAQLYGTNNFIATFLQAIDHQEPAEKSEFKGE